MGGGGWKNKGSWADRKNPHGTHEGAATEIRRWMVSIFLYQIMGQDNARKALRRFASCDGATVIAVRAELATMIIATFGTWVQRI